MKRKRENININCVNNVAWRRYICGIRVLSVEYWTQSYEKPMKFVT